MANKQGRSNLVYDHPRVTEIFVDGLFGAFTYNIRSEAAGDPDRPSLASNMIIMYGANGSGKTTVLKAAFDLLSPGQSHGHRTALAQLEFREIAIRFSNSIEISAFRTSIGTGDYQLRLTRMSEVLAEADVVTAGPEMTVANRNRARLIAQDQATRLLHGSDFDPSVVEGMIVSLRNSLLERPGSPKDRDEISDFYETFRVAIGLDVYFLGDDRKLQNDNLHDRFRRKKSTRAYPVDTVEPEQSDLSIALAQAMDWLSQQSYSATRSGSESSDSIYLNVLSRLATLRQADSSTIKSVKHLQHELADLAEVNRRYAKFGLIPKLNTESLSFEIAQLVDGAGSGSDGLLTVASPFVDGLKERLKALEPTYRALEGYVNSVNAFFRGKELGISLNDGIHIITDAGVRLDPDRLSSGERQILGLFTTFLFTRNAPSLFIIDEPEISLNVEWQRALAPALLGVAKDTASQFLMASHSIEILSGAPDCVAMLENMSPQLTLFSEFDTAADPLR